MRINEAGDDSRSFQVDAALRIELRCVVTYKGDAPGMYSDGFHSRL